IQNQCPGAEPEQPGQKRWPIHLTPPYPSSSPTATGLRWADCRDRPVRHSKRISVIVAHTVARRPVRRAVRPVVVAVALVPLLLAELPAFLRLMLAQLLTVAVHVPLVLLVIAQATPFGSLVRSGRIFAPISGAAPVIVSVRVRTRRNVIRPGSCIITRS